MVREKEIATTFDMGYPAMLVTTNYNKVTPYSNTHTHTHTHTQTQAIKCTTKMTRAEQNSRYIYTYQLQNTLPFIIYVQEAALYVREGELNDKFYSHPTGRWSKLAYIILHHSVFHVFDLLLSILLMLLALIEKPSVFGPQSDEQPLVSVSSC